MVQSCRLEIESQLSDDNDSVQQLSGLVTQFNNWVGPVDKFSWTGVAKCVPTIGLKYMTLLCLCLSFPILADLKAVESAAVEKTPCPL